MHARHGLVTLTVVAMIGAIACDAPQVRAACLPHPDGLVAWYSGEGHPYDLTGSNHALGHGALQYVPGQVGQGFGFDGASAYLDILDSDELDALVDSGFTIAAWLKFPAGSAATQFILDKRELVGPGDARGIALYLQGGHLGLQLNDATGSSDFVAAGPDLRDGDFHFVSVVVDRSSPTGGSIRVDAQEVATFDPTVRPGSLATAGGLRIGRYMFESLADYWLSGVVDELDLYARALAPAELAALQGAVPDGKCQPGYFFGEDLNTTDSQPPPDDPVRPESLPNCRAAQMSFLAALGSAPVVNGFEDIPTGGQVTQLAFGSTTAAVQGALTVLEIPTGTFNGAYPTLGQRCGFQFGNGDSFTLSFATPQTAIGFMGTDIGDGGARLLLAFHRTDGTTSNVVVPHSTSASGSWPNLSGSALFFGLVDAVHPFDAVTFTNPRANLDGFGFDEMTVAGEASSVRGAAIVRHYLQQNRPNPFNPRTVLGFDLPAPGHVRLDVHDVAGRLIRTLVDAYRSEGSHELVWDGRDAQGREAGSGTYVARLAFAGRSEAIRIGLVR